MWPRHGHVYVCAAWLTREISSDFANEEFPNIFSPRNWYFVYLLLVYLAILGHNHHARRFSEARRSHHVDSTFLSRDGDRANPFHHWHAPMTPCCWPVDWIDSTRQGFYRQPAKSQSKSVASAVVQLAWVEACGGLRADTAATRRHGPNPWSPRANTSQLTSHVASFALCRVSGTHLLPHPLSFWSKNSNNSLADEQKRPPEIVHAISPTEGSSLRSTVQKGWIIKNLTRHFDNCRLSDMFTDYNRKHTA